MEIRLTVPEAHRGPFRELAQMDQKKFDVIGETLDSYPESLELETYIDAISESEAELSRQQIEDLLRASLSLAASSTSHGWPIDQVADHVSRSDDLGLKADITERFTARLNFVLSSQVITMLEATRRMSFSSERVLHGVQVVPKLAFASPKEEGGLPRAAVPTFELIVDYFSGSGRDSISIGVDRDDLQMLVEAAQRGLDSWEWLSEFVRSQGILTED